jgi:hypothetical protein
MTALSGIEQNIGAHRVLFTPPDELEIKLEGPLSVVEAEGIVALIQELGRLHGPLFTMTDVSRFQASGTRVRQVFIEAAGEPYRISAGVIWGAAFAVRIAMAMVLRASPYIRPGGFSFPVQFVATEAQAREWLESQRKTGPKTHRGAQLRPSAT